MTLENPPIQEKATDEQTGMFPQVWLRWFGNVVTNWRRAFRSDGSFIPVSLADTAAQNNSVYYSTTQSKLVYKDSGGTVNDLY